MLITQPRSKKNPKGPRTSQMGLGGAVWEKKPNYKKSHETVPLSNARRRILGNFITSSMAMKITRLKMIKMICSSLQSIKK